MVCHLSLGVVLPVLVEPFKNRIIADGHNESELRQMSSMVIPSSYVRLDTKNKMAKVVKRPAASIVQWKHLTS